MTEQSRPRVVVFAADFMAPYWAPEWEAIRLAPDEPWRETLAYAAGQGPVFAYSMNCADAYGAGIESFQRQALVECRRHGIPTVWHTIEDPNHFEHFREQARGFDFVFTSDREMIPGYRQFLGHEKVWWLPLACQPAMHYPLPTEPDAADFVLIANYYPYETRVEAVSNLITPIILAGHSLALFAYANPDGTCCWPEPFSAHWKGATSCYDVTKFYPKGRIALGLNCQTHQTTMTSMRTYEALACEKPFLAAHSDAYEPLGFRNGVHFRWTGSREETMAHVRLLLNEPGVAVAMATIGVLFVWENHTYAHRLQRILAAMDGKAKPGELT
ncbi:MAG: glycosyltransferase [bacterium]